MNTVQFHNKLVTERNRKRITLVYIFQSYRESKSGTFLWSTV